MKRLLAYLLIVLGLGLTFSANSSGETASPLIHKKSFSKGTVLPTGICVHKELGTNTLYLQRIKGTKIKKDNTWDYYCPEDHFISKKKYKKQYKYLKKFTHSSTKWAWKIKEGITYKNTELIQVLQTTHIYDLLIKKEKIYKKKIADQKRKIEEENKNIAKAEPSQKEKLSNNKETVYGSGSTNSFQSSNQTTSQFNQELCNNSKRMAIEDALSNAKTIKKIKTKNVTILKERIVRSERRFAHKKCYVEVKVDLSYGAKEVKVAKTEPKQEEFKPETGDIDNEAPVIEIAEAITVDSQAYTLKGKAKDKNKFYLEIDGEPVKVGKNGKFEFEGFVIDPEEGEVIKIIATDKRKNRSEKIVKINVDLKATTVAKTYEKLKPNSIRVKTDKNKIAIIIGAENYKNMTKCNYCNRDAKAFRAYATQALGVHASNIITLIDEDATRGQILKTFKIQLRKIAADGGKDIHVFFAGHGLASENGDDIYLIPQDGDQSLLEDTAVSRVNLIKLIKKVNPKSVTMFIDSCYSGQTRSEKMLVASLRGLKKIEEGEIPDNFTIFTASSSNQGSSHIEEAKHGMFSYYLMKGLEGKADSNKDKKITNGELIDYLKTNVSKVAFIQNREQDPMLTGERNKVLISYK